MYNRWISDDLEHHQVKGAHWGVHNGPPYPLDSSKSDGHRLLSDGSPQGKKKLRKTKTVFVSGSSKTQDPQSGYYRGELPKDIRLVLREHIRNGDKIIVGDAPGIDRQVQDYLKKQQYDNVEIYGPGKAVRYSANPKWKTNPIDDPDHEPDSKEWLAKKDIAMTEAADEGLAIILDDGAKATRNNVRRLLESQKAAKVYSLNKDGTNMWADEKELMSDKVVPKTTITSKSVSKANKIYDSLSDQEKYFLMAEKNAPRYVNPEEYGKKGSNVYSRIEQYKDTPVSVIDIWKNYRNGADVSIAVRNDEKFRHKGYASRALENGLKYFYEHPDIEYLVWGVNAENHPSIELAKKYGFEFYDDLGDGWQTYIIDKEAKHSMAYNRWISPYYLEHHQVLGAHWGVHNGPPYPLDRSKSDGHKLVKGAGAPQDKKKNRVSENSVRRRASKQGRSDVTDIESAKKKLAELGVDKAGRDEFDLWAQEIPEKDRAKWMQDMIDETATKAKQEKLDRADKEGEYELDFLEYVQNEDFYEDYDHKRMLKEYSEYLDDRDAYAQKGLSDETKIAGMQREAKAMLPKDTSLSAKMRKASLFNRDGTLNAKGQKYYNVRGDGTLSFEELELRKDVANRGKSGTEDDVFDRYITKSEGLDTSMLSKANKSKKEKQLLDLWYKDNLTDRESAIVGALHQRIAHKSGSWYFGESVTEKFQKALKRERAAHKAFMDNGRNEKTVHELDTARRNLCKAVLMDLGYEVNADNIQLIEGWIIDD